MDVPRHDADFALTRRDDSRAVGTDQTRLAGRQIGFHFDHVEHRHAFGNANDEFDPRGHRFEHRVGGERRRHVNYRRVASGRFARLLDRVENRDAFEVGAAFARHHAADHLRAVLFARARVELAHSAGNSLRQHAGVLIN